MKTLFENFKEITIMGFGGSASGDGSCMSGEMFLVSFVCMTLKFRECLQFEPECS